MICLNNPISTIVIWVIVDFVADWLEFREIEIHFEVTRYMYEDTK